MQRFKTLPGAAVPFQMDYCFICGRKYPYKNFLLDGQFYGHVYFG